MHTHTLHSVTQIERLQWYIYIYIYTTCVIQQSINFTNTQECRLYIWRPSRASRIYTRAAAYVGHKNNIQLGVDMRLSMTVSIAGGTVCRKLCSYKLNICYIVVFTIYFLISFKHVRAACSYTPLEPHIYQTATTWRLGFPTPRGNPP